jgi:hypothetical protein
VVDDLGYPSVVGTGTRPDAATSLGRLCASGSSAASRVPGGACVPQPFRARPRDATPEISDGRETPTPVPGKRRRGLAAVVGLCSGHPTIRKAPIGRPIRRRVSLLFRAAPAPPRRSFRKRRPRAAPPLELRRPQPRPLFIASSALSGTARSTLDSPGRGGAAEKRHTLQSARSVLAPAERDASLTQPAASRCTAPASR